MGFVAIVNFCCYRRNVIFFASATFYDRLDNIPHFIRTLKFVRVAARPPGSKSLGFFHNEICFLFEISADL